MSFFNALYMLSNLGSKWGNYDIENMPKVDLKEFRRKNNLSFLNDLPDFDNTKNYIIVNNRKVMAGTILMRPLDLIEIISSLKVEYHYAAVLGTSVGGKGILIEMTKGRNVNITTKQGFLVNNRFTEKDIELFRLPPEGITREQIIERAKAFQYESYDLLDLNCKDFVQNLIWDVPLPRRSLDVKKGQLQLCDIHIGFLKIYLSNPENDDYRDIILDQIKDAEADKKRLINYIDRCEKSLQKVIRTPQ